MNDLVRPTTPFTRALIPASAPGGVLATVSNPPPPVTQLPAGSTLTGVVVGHDAEGHTLVRTDLGTLAVATKAQLPVNSEVTLHIRSSGGQLHILIMHSEAPPSGAQGAAASHPQTQAGAQTGAQTGAQIGAPGPRNAPTTAPTNAPTNAPAAAATPTTVQAAPIPTSDLLTLGQSVRAVVQSPAAIAPAASIQTGPGGIAGAGAGAVQPANPALTALASQLIPGSELQLRIVTVQAPGLQTAPGTPGAAPGAAPGAPGTPGAPGATPGAAVPGAAPGLTSQSSPYTAPPGSGGPAATQSSGPPGAPTTPSGPPGTTAPQTGALAGPLAPASPPASASPHITGQGVTAGPAGAGAPTAPIPGVLSSTAPASGVAASYAAAGGISGVIPLAEARAAVIDMMPKTSGLLAAHGIGQAAATSGSRSATTTAGTGPAVTPSATPPTTAATNQGATSPTTGGGAGGALQFTGSVTTVSIAGHPILQTPLGTLSLEIRAALQIGSKITFELSNTTSLPSGPQSGLQPGSAMAVPEPTSLSTLAYSWPALDEALQTLHQAGPPIATTAAAIRDAIPQPGTRLASGMLFFLSALSGGDMTRWLGSQALQALKTAGREGLLARLGQDFEQLGRLADNPGGEWRLFSIPLLDGDQVRQLRFFLRQGQQDGDGDGHDEDEEKTRFVVEVALSSLGDLQLDGLVREKRLDLILRSRAPLPAFMRRDIMQIFHDANEITGYRGSIGFQSSIDWKAIAIEPPEADASPGVVV